MKDHEVAMLVNELRLIAVTYADAGQLRARISECVTQAIKHAAPVVERQDAIGTLRRVGQVIVFDANGDPHIKDGMEVFTAPPELAELQANVAKLSKIEDSIDARQNRIDAINLANCVDFGFDGKSVKVTQEAYSIFIAREAHYQATIAQQAAEIERLNGGQGEPVAYLRNEGTPNNLVMSGFGQPGAFKVFRELNQ